MSTAMLHHTRHEKSQAHDSDSRIPWHFFIAIALLQAKPNLINIHEKTKYKNVEVTKLKTKPKNLKLPHPWNQARCRVACWREKGYQKLQYLQKEDGADNGLLQSLLSTCFNPITSFQRKWVLTKWTASCWQTLPISFFSPALPFSHFKRQTTRHSSKQYQYPQNITSVEPLV